MVHAGNIADADMIAAGDGGKGLARLKGVLLQSVGGRSLRGKKGNGAEACKSPLESVSFQIGASFQMLTLGWQDAASR